MRANEARAYSEQVIAAFNGGESAKVIGRTFGMHERHVAMILREAGIDPKSEYKKRISDGTYKAKFQRQYDYGDSWYIAKYGKTKEYFDKRREAEKEEREHRERNAALLKLSKTIERYAIQRNREEERKQREEERYAPKIATCKHCGKEWIFYPSRERYGKKTPPLYCSSKCKKRSTRFGKSSGHRLRIYGRGNEPRDVIKLKSLVERDGGICYLCGREIDWNDFTTDSAGNFICGSSYPTVEHLKPLARGGTHTWDNVRLAHHLCNSIKGTAETTTIGVYGFQS